MGFLKKLGRVTNLGHPHTWILGKKQSSTIDLAGQAIGAYDDQYKPQDVQAPETPNPQDAYVQRDRIRRRVAKAMGQPSTIRAGTLSQPYTAAPAKLLGG